VVGCCYECGTLCQGNSVSFKQHRILIVRNYTDGQVLGHDLAVGNLNIMGSSGLDGTRKPGQLLGVRGLRNLGSPNVMLLPCLITRSREVKGLTLAAGGRSSRRYRLELEAGAF